MVVGTNQQFWPCVSSYAELRQVAMPLLEMDDYSPKARAYWWVTACIGTCAFVYAAACMPKLDNATLVQVLAGIAIVGVTGIFPVQIPGTKTSIAGGEIFIFLILLLLSLIHI